MASRAPIVLIALLLAIVAMATVVAGDENAAAKAPGKLLETLSAQEKQLYEAWKKRDVDTVQKALPEDYLEINSFFGRMNKTQVLQDLFPHFFVSSYSLEDIRVTQPTPDTALLTYRLTFTGRFKEKNRQARPCRHRFTCIARTSGC